jgi:hypothetical protein
VFFVIEFSKTVIERLRFVAKGGAESGGFAAGSDRRKSWMPSRQSGRAITANLRLQYASNYCQHDFTTFNFGKLNRKGEHNSNQVDRDGAVAIITSGFALTDPACICQPANHSLGCVD